MTKFSHRTFKQGLQLLLKEWMVYPRSGLVGAPGKGMASALFPQSIPYKHTSEFGSFTSSQNDTAEKALTIHRLLSHGGFLTFFFFNKWPGLRCSVIAAQNAIRQPFLHGLLLLRLVSLYPFLLQIPSVHGWPPDGGLSALTKLPLVRPPCGRQGVTFFPFLLVKTDWPCILSFLGSALCSTHLVKLRQGKHCPGHQQSHVETVHLDCSPSP